MKKNSLLLSSVFTSTSLFALMSMTPVLAQTADADKEADKPVAERTMKLGSITVTAQRREETVNEVPMAIQAFSGDQLDLLNATDVEDLEALVPSFSVSQSYQGVPTYTLRGIGFNTINVSATSTVGTYVDEVAYPYPFMNSGPMFDIERVEVLKGPQGTLFGRNTTAGLINMVTNKPTKAYESSIGVDVGNYDTFNLEGMVNLPLSDKIQSRIAFRKETSSEGWQKSITRGEDRGTIDKLGYRFSLAVELTEKMDVDFSYNGWVNKSDTIAGQGIGLTPNTDPTFIVPGTNGPSTASGFNQPGLVNFLANNFPTNAKQADWAPISDRSLTIGAGKGIDGPLEEDSKFDAFKLGFDYLFDNDVKFVSLTGYNKLDRQAVLDWSGAPYQILVQDVEAEIKSFSQELRFEGENGPAKWLVGAYYGKDEITDGNQTLLRDNANSNFVSTAAYLLTVNPAALGFPPQIAGLVSLVNIDPESGQPYSAAELLNSFQTYFDTGDFESETWSIFANTDWEITPSLTLTTGLRYTDDSQKYVGCSGDIGGSMQPNVNVFNRVFFTTLYGLTAPPTALPENGCNTYDLTTNSFGPVVSDTKEDNVSWRVVANWSPASLDSTLFFASVSKGFKSASTPVNAASKSEQNQPATQESLLAYELGVKSGLFDGKVQANASVFYYDYKDKQISSFFPDPIYRALSRLQNAPEGEAYGFETDITWSISDDLTAVGGMTLLHTEFGDFNTSDAFGLPTNRAGDPFLYSPEEVFNLTLVYDRPLNDTLGVSAVLNGRWQSDSTAGIPSDSAFDIDSYGILNGSIGLYSLNDSWEFSIWGKNLTDEYYWNQVVGNANVNVRFAGKPRTFGASLNYRF